MSIIIRTIAKNGANSGLYRLKKADTAIWRKGMKNERSNGFFCVMCISDSMREDGRK